jgi:hypothetical protein
MSIRFQPNAKPIIYSMQPKYTPADFIRFQYLYKLLDDIIPWQEYVANEPKDLSSQASKLMTGFYFWLYSNDENREEEEQRRNKPPFSWQKLFAGSNRSRQSNPFASSSYSEESQALLIEEADEQDATEINNNQVFEAVAARASTEAAMNNGDITDKNKALIR